MRVLVTGVTGTAGQGALLAALRDARVTSVLALARRPVAVTDAKLTVVQHADFADYSAAAVQSELATVDACLWCLGISTTQVSGAAEYEKITYDYALAAAKALAAANPKATFLFVSGNGADSTERSRILFARVKGRTENALFKLGQPRTVVFRPGGIFGPTPPTGLANRIVYSMAPVFLRVLPSMSITADDLGRALVEVAVTGGGVTGDRPILENPAIRAIAASSAVPPA